MSPKSVHKLKLQEDAHCVLGGCGEGIVWFCIAHKRYRDSHLTSLNECVILDPLASCLAVFVEDVDKQKERLEELAV